HCPAMDFLSSMLVAQSASENPAMSRSVEGLNIGSPSVVNCLSVTIGVGHDDAFSMLNFLSKSYEIENRE
ncbi:hypothetical protein A2U01_0055245, partial [Trifolium medium]|nr:hypothetical protein [Trifolium medium]